MSGVPPRVSVIMAVHNGERFLREATESILSQTFADFEFIIVDDGSTDGTSGILDSFADPRIVRIANEKNLGLAASLNLGIAAARAEFIARMDADDVSAPTRLEKQIAYLAASPETVLLGTAYEEIDATGRVIGFGDPSLRDDDLQAELMSRNRFCHGSVMMRADALTRVGGYDENYPRSQDYDLWLRLAECGAVANLREYLYRRRMHEGRVSVRQSDQQTTHARRAASAAWRRRAWTIRLYPPARLTAWARVAVRERRWSAAAALLLKSVLRAPWSPVPWRLAMGRLAWSAAGALGVGKAAAIRNEKRIRREIADGRTVLRSHPSHLTWLLVDKCNSKCVMCGGGYFGHTSGRRLTEEKCERILDHLRPKLLTSVMFGGAGEPLLNPDFAAIVELTRRRCPDADLLLITNGITLNADAIEVLVRHRVNALISINAATAETYRRVAQVDQFDAVCRNVRALTVAAAEAEAPLRVTLSMVGMKRNIAELPALVRLAAELGVHGVLMNYCRFYPESLRFKSYDDPANRLAEEESLFMCRTESDRFLVEARHAAAESGVCLEHEPLFAAPPPQGGHCDYPWRALLVGFDGEAYWCPGGEVLFESAVNDGHYESGNLLDSDMDDVWNGPFFIGIREGISGRRKKIPECAVCGNRIEWVGPRARDCHILDWRAAYVSAKGSAP